MNLTSVTSKHLESKLSLQSIIKTELNKHKIQNISLLSFMSLSNFSFSAILVNSEKTGERCSSSSLLSIRHPAHHASSVDIQ
jgi:hypothetical protein